MKLNAKVFLIVVVSTLLCEGSIFIFTKLTVQNAVRQYVVNDGLREFKQLASEFRLALSSHDTDQLLSILQEAVTGTDGVYAFAFDSQGKILAQTVMDDLSGISNDAAFQSGVMREHYQTRLFNFNGDSIFEITAPVYSQGLPPNQPLGVVRLGISMRTILITERHIFNQMLLIMLGAGLVTTALAMYFSENIIKRIRHLSAGTLCIRNGEYNTTVPVETQDEISELAENFNAMTKALRETTVSKHSLQESEERFRQLAENVHEVFWLCSPDNSQMFYVSPAYEKIWGRTCESLYQRPTSFADAIHPDDRDRVLAATQTLEKGFDQKYRIVQQDGSCRWIHARAFPVYDHDGKPSRIAGIATDITDIQESTDQLQFQNVLLQTQQEVALDGILVVDHNRKIVSYNRKFAEMWRIPADALATRSDELALRAVLDQLVDPEAFLQKVQFLYENPNEVTQDEITLVDNRVFDRYSAPMRDKAGTHYGRVWYFRDITERKRALQQLALIGTALGQTKESIVITDRAGTVEYVNAAFERVTGYSMAEVVGHNPRLLKSGQHSPEFYAHMWSTLEKGEVWEGVFINKRKDGSLYHEETSINPVRNDHGQIAHFVAVKRDVTQRLKMEEIIRQQDKMYAVGTLAAGVAHEINNPLGVILGFSQAVSHRLAANDPLEMPLKSIEQEALRCKNLVQDLLTFSRVSKIEREPVDLNRTIEGSLSLISTKAKMTRITVQKNLGCDLPHLLGNANQIQQVIVNLAGNAIDAMEDHGTLTITTECLQAGPLAWICLKVMDTGPGIPPEILPRIFEPFFTTKPVGKGTGIGLSLVHEIVQKHSGTIEVQSRPGSTEFCVKFPTRNTAEQTMWHAGGSVL